MLHYVLFQLKPELTADAMEKLYERTYARLGETLPGVLDTSFYRNCVSRECNMDVMIVVHLSGRDALGEYLQHPLHLEFIKCTHDHVVQRVSFDWSEEEEHMIDGILLNEADNVVTVTREIVKGEKVVYGDQSASCQITAVEDIPQFHKISTEKICEGGAVIKYGERIGYATKDILPGQHVHTHNVADQ